MSRYDIEETKYKGLYYPKYTLLKSYIFGFLLSAIITCPIYLAILNVIDLTHYLSLFILLLLITSLVLIYLTLFFKDKLLENYCEKAKDVNLAYIRLVDILIISVVLLTFYLIYIFIFGWW